MQTLIDRRWSYHDNPAYVEIRDAHNHRVFLRRHNATNRPLNIALATHVVIVHNAAIGEGAPAPPAAGSP